MNISDTIAAIATPLVPSAIGIIRISGPNVSDVIHHCFGKNINELSPKQMNRGIFIDKDKAELDDCCYVYYKSPSSYTGEDSCEIFAHGSVYILKTMLSSICLIGNCRIAKHGEFTQRAFINGKIPLSKAESIIDIIESNSQTAHDIALNQYKGYVYQTITRCRQKLMQCLEKVEASLEFPDEVGNIKDSTVANDVESINSELVPIIKASDYGSTLKNGLKFVIIGKPNAGKSSLLNALAGENRSIVTNTPGTTRDYIDVSIEYNGVLIQIIDTAGLRDTSNNIEQLGIDKISELSESTDGIIQLMDIQEDTAPIQTTFGHNKPILQVFNKIDTQPTGFKQEPDFHYISCTTKQGIMELKESLITTFISPEDYKPTQMLCNVRQITELNKAKKYIEQTLQRLNENAELDIVAIDIHDAIKCLANITGEDYTEELLDGIFANFCIGK